MDFKCPVLIEFKRLNNPEIQNVSERAAYKAKLCTYLGANCGIGIYAVFRTKAVKTHQANYDKLIFEYSDIQGLSFNYQDCLEVK